MTVDEMPAGRELDALVAARVFGADLSIAPAHTWELNEAGEIDVVAWDSDYHNGPSCTRCGYSFCIHCEGETAYTAAPCQVEPPRYSTNITAAWQVVEYITWPERAPANTRFAAAWDAADVWAMDASQAAEFISRAALAAVRGTS